MKGEIGLKYILGIILALVLVLGAAGAASAAPVSAGSEGQLFLFGELDPMVGMPVGIGYNVSDTLAIGAFYSWGPDALGAFAILSFDPFVLNAEAVFYTPGVFGKVSATYNFDLDPLTLGLGGGCYFEGGGSIFFLEAAANLVIGDMFSLYGAVDYYFVGIPFFEYKVGISLAL